MKNTPTNHATPRLGIGLGAALGALFGSSLADLFSASSLAGVIGMALGAALGAAIGARVSPQIHWMEYSPAVRRRILLSGVLFFAVLPASLYWLDRGLAPSLQYGLLALSVLAGLFFFHSIAFAISQLDDLQRKIQTEGLAFGFGITLFLVLVLGLLSQVVPLQVDWLLLAVIMLASWLLGKLLLVWKYR